MAKDEAKDVDEFAESSDKNASGLSDEGEQKMIEDMREKVLTSPTFGKIAPQDAERVRSRDFDWWFRRFLDRFVALSGFAHMENPIISIDENDSRL